ncbi:MAG TPA: hypothetical protein VIU43_01220 [Nitrosospira sp.]
MEIINTELRPPQPIDKVLLRPHQMIQHAQDIEQCKQDLDNKYIQKKGDVRKRLQKLEKQMVDQAPQPVTNPILRDKMAKLAKQLESEIAVGMPTAEEMRKAPPTVVEQHRRWERANKKKIKVWRNLQRQLHTDTAAPETWDRSIGDTERLRPHSVGQSRYVSDALIPGAFSMSDLPAEKWDAIFDHQPNSALEQAKKVHAEKEEKPKGKRTLSPEQKAAAAERLKKARAVAAMKRQAASTSTESVVPAQE